MKIKNEKVKGAAKHRYKIIMDREGSPKTVTFLFKSMAISVCLLYFRKYLYSHDFLEVVCWVVAILVFMKTRGLQDQMVT